MIKYILALFSFFLFTACTNPNTQVNIQSEKNSLKRAVVKLIRENARLKESIRKQEELIEDNQEVILLLKKDLDADKKRINKNTKFLKYIAKKIKNSDKATEKLQNKKKKVYTQIIPLKIKNIQADSFIKVKTKVAHIRAKPTKNSEILGYVQKDTIFEVLDKSNHEFPWYKVYFKGKSAWISFAVVDLVKKQREVSENLIKIKVDVKKANLRFKPDIDSKIVAKAKKGEVFKVLQKVKKDYTWYKIIKDALPVWIYAGLAKEIKKEKNVK